MARTSRSLFAVALVVVLSALVAGCPTLTRGSHASGAAAAGE